MTEWTLSSHHKKWYGLHYRELEPVADRCCEMVRGEGAWASFRQCTRPRGYGPEQAYCKQHDPAKVEERKKASQAKWDADWEKRKIELSASSLFAALCKIADGDNDPRSTALEAIKDLKRPDRP